GTTYAIGVQRISDERIRKYCTGRAVQAFESAISLEPDNLSHRVNLALCYTEDPPQDNPMKGILMLVDLNKQHPENVLVLSNLARLAMKTGQFDKAVERLQQALAVEPENVRVNCMLAQAFESAGKAAEAAPFQQKCVELSGR
ncbi:MAG: tetratricopeptide repeat protein, partial [Bacteroidota bacterium]